MRRTVRRAAWTSLLSVAVVAASVGMAWAKPPVANCGQQITADFTLLNDVGPCDGPGLVVSGDNLTLNLNGHRVFGNADRGVGVEASGIVLRQTKGVTVIGGRDGARVDSFEAGVFINGGSGNAVMGVTIRDNIGQDPTVAGNNAFFGDGVLVLSSSDNRIANNVITRNGFYDNVGVLGFGADRNVVQGNEVTEAQTFDIRNFNGTLGIGVFVSAAFEDPSPTPGASVLDNKIIANTVSRNDGRGISNQSALNGLVRDNLVESNGQATFRECPDPPPYVDACGVSELPGIGVTAGQLADRATHFVIERNTVRGNPLGIIMSTNENVVRNNVLVDNPPWGFRSNGNMYVGGARNDYSDNKITGGFIGFQLCCATDNDTISKNSITDSRGYGLVVSGVPGNHHVVGNEVHRNRYTGIWARTLNSELVYNNAADNAQDPRLGFFSADLAESFPDCSSGNRWFGNIWGSGGYNQPCVTTGGSGPNPPAVASGLAATAGAHDASPVLGDEGPAPAAPQDRGEQP